MRCTISPFLAILSVFLEKSNQFYGLGSMMFTLLLVLLQAVCALRLDITSESLTSAHLTVPSVGKVLQSFLNAGMYETVLKLLQFKSVNMEAVYASSFTSSEAGKKVCLKGNILKILRYCKCYLDGTFGGCLEFGTNQDSFANYSHFEYFCHYKHV